MSQLSVLDKLENIFYLETVSKTDSMYYIEKLYKKDIEDFEKTSALDFPCINFEVQPDLNIENGLANVQNNLIPIRIYAIFRCGANHDIQIGRNLKSKKSILDVIDDMINILNDNVQVSDYWTQITITGGGKINLEGEQNIYKGRYIDINVWVRNQ